MMAKRVSPAAINALKDALTYAYWYKRDLRSFLLHALSSHEVVSSLNWQDYKRNIVTALVEHLARRQDQHLDDLLTLIDEVLKIEDFAHLEQLEDGQEKGKKARSAIDALRKHAGRYVDFKEEKEAAARRRDSKAREREAVRGVQQRLETLKGHYYALLSNPPQQRGFALEKLLPELFDVFDMDPKASFRVTGEQIDGAFAFDSLDYLLEARWQNAPVGSRDLDSLAGKIGRRLDNTLGLFLSINGYSEDGVEAFSKSRSVLILMDGADLAAVLEGRIALDDLLRRKRKLAAQRGQIYLRIQDVL